MSDIVCSTFGRCHRTGPSTLAQELKEAGRAARESLKVAKQTERDSIKAYHAGIKNARKSIVVPPSPVVLAPSIPSKVPCLAKSATLPGVSSFLTVPSDAKSATLPAVSSFLTVPSYAKSATLPAVPPAPSTQSVSNVSTVAKKPIVKKTGVWPVRPKSL